MVLPLDALRRLVYRWLAFGGRGSALDNSYSSLSLVQRSSACTAEPGGRLPRRVVDRQLEADIVDGLKKR